MKLCTIDGCGKRHKGHGFCEMHWERWRRHGDPHVVIRPADRARKGWTPPEDRFWKHVQVTDGCWFWTGAENGRGYGSLATGKKPGHKVYAHRLSYEMHVGPIPDGYHIDHLCRVRNCVNPDHLEAVTPEENNRRSDSPSAELARKTHCKRGHPLSGDNLYLQPVKDRPNPSRQCNECRRIRMRANYWRKKGPQQ